MCMVAACEKWLEIDKDACWQNVVDALDSIGQKRRAHAIEEKYINVVSVET